MHIIRSYVLPLLDAYGDDTNNIVLIGVMYCDVIVCILTVGSIWNALGIEHSNTVWWIRPSSRTMEVSKYHEKGVLEWMK